MSIGIKICGIRRTEDALAAEELGASAVGFVFYRKSTRYIEPEDAKRISSSLGPFIARIGVFVDEDPAVVRSIVETVGLSGVQLHGSETPEYCARLAGIPLVKAFRVGDGFDATELRHYSATAFLFDTMEDGAYGGTGKTFDWRLTRDAHRYWRIILAGGLDPDNVGNAIRAVKPWAVDVSSGIEKRPGLKDLDLMRSFVEAVKSADSELN